MITNAFNKWINSYRGIPPKIWALASISFVNRCGGMVIAFMTLYLTQKLGYSIKESGVVLSFFGVGAVIGALMGGWLTDKLGYTYVQFWSLIFNGLMLITLMFVQKMFIMCFAIGALSLISEVFRPANSVAIAHNSAPENRTRSYSLMRMSFNLGWTVAPALGGMLLLFGWEWLFWVDGLTCITAAFLLKYLLGNKSEKTVFKKDEEKADEMPVLPYKDRKFIYFFIFTMLGAMVFMQILWTVPVFFKEVYHWHESQIGLMTALNGALVVVIEMPLIFRIENKKTHLYWVRFGLITYALAYLCFLMPMAGLAAALSYMFFISIGEIFVMPFSTSWVVAKSGNHNQGKYLAFYTLAYSLANVLAPLLATQIIGNWGYQVLWVVLIVMSGVVYFGMLSLQKKTILVKA